LLEEEALGNAANKARDGQRWPLIPVDTGPMLAIAEKLKAWFETQCGVEAWDRITWIPRHVRHRQ
jgi:hypothetical protein